MMGSKTVFKDSLHWVERWFYWIAGIASIAYGLNCFRLESERFQRSQHATVLSKGWHWLNRPRDLTDVEWMEWRVLVWTQVPICFLRVVINYSCHRWHIRPVIYKLIVIAVDILSLSFFASGQAVVMIMIQAALMFLMTYTNSVLAVWCLGLTMIQSLNYSSAVTSKVKYLGMGNNMKAFNMFFTAEAFFHLKIISFGIEKVQHNIYKAKTKSNDVTTSNVQVNMTATASLLCNGNEEKTSVKESDKLASPSAILVPTNTKDGLRSDPEFIDLIYYTFSLPMFFDGPIYNYDDFHNQLDSSLRSNSEKPNSDSSVNVKSDAEKPDVKDILWSMFKILLWAVFIEFQCHFFYHQAIHLAPSFLESMNLPAVLAMGYFQGQFFMVKYLCMYGLAMQWLRFEGIQPHDQPRCISWIYSYTDMWKYFDVGLHKFLKAYIFLPCAIWQPGLIGKLLSCWLVFLFVYVFHGTYTAMLIWCVGNFVIFSIETTACLVVTTSIGKYISSYLSPAMQLRLRAIFFLPLYVASCILIFYFFFEETAGAIFYKRIYGQASWSDILLQGLVYYVNIQNAMYIYDRKSCKRS